MAKIYEHDFTKRHTKSRLIEIADKMLEAQAIFGFKISARGWCYWAESERIINKDQFDKFEDLINRCRKRGLLPIDFVAEEVAREFSGVEVPYNGTIGDHLLDNLDYTERCHNWYKCDWWEGEEYYIQMVVEKVDLKALFEPVAHKYHIPVANSRGWSSMLQRAKYARRFQEAKARGLKCVLLYCGDHDPDGLRISDSLRKNLEQIKNVTWDDGTHGYDPEDLIIHRFGLDKEFIDKHKLTWIDNLITGSGKNLASKDHKNFNLPYVQHYLKTIGARKCEANAVITIHKEAREYCKDAILEYLGKDALVRFKRKESAAKSEINELKELIMWDDYLAAAKQVISERES